MFPSEQFASNHRLILFSLHFFLFVCHFCHAVWHGSACLFFSFTLASVACLSLFCDFSSYDLNSYFYLCFIFSPSLLHCMYVTVLSARNISFHSVSVLFNFFVLNLLPIPLCYLIVRIGILLWPRLINKKDWRKID